MAHDVLAAECFDCSLPYDDAWVECVIPNDVWKEISPDHQGNGLLCINCMAKRCRARGYITVWAKITAGPFCMRFDDGT